MLSPGRGLLIALFFVIGCHDASSAEIDKVALQINGVTRNYLFYQPQSVHLQEAAPLLVLLHGSEQDGLVMLNAWVALADSEGVVIAAPNSKDPSYWHLKIDGPDFIQCVIADVFAKQPIDRTRIYLFGYSGGAVYAHVSHGGVAPFCRGGAVCRGLAGLA